MYVLCMCIKRLLNKNERDQHTGNCFFFFLDNKLGFLLLISLIFVTFSGAAFYPPKVFVFCYCCFFLLSVSIVSKSWSIKCNDGWYCKWENLYFMHFIHIKYSWYRLNLSAASNTNSPFKFAFFPPPRCFFGLKYSKLHCTGRNSSEITAKCLHYLLKDIFDRVYHI